MTKKLFFALSLLALSIVASGLVGCAHETRVVCDGPSCDGSGNEKRLENFRNRQEALHPKVFAAY